MNARLVAMENVYNMRFPQKKNNLRGSATSNDNTFVVIVALLTILKIFGG